MFGIAGETRGRVPDGGWPAHGFPLLTLGAHLPEQVPRHLLIFTLSMSFIIYNNHTYFARSIVIFLYFWFRFVLDSTLMVDFMPFFVVFPPVIIIIIIIIIIFIIINIIIIIIIIFIPY